MTNQPTNQAPFPATAIRTPAAQTLELLTRMAEIVETQSAQIEFLTNSVKHLIEIVESSAETSQDVAEGFAKLGEAMTTWRSGSTGSPAAPELAEGQGSTVVFTAEKLTLGYDDNGKPIYKIFGGRWQKFGVRVWPETLPLLSVDAGALKPGPNAFCVPVVALMGEKGPQKVIGLAGGNVAPIVVEAQPVVAQVVKPVAAKNEVKTITCQFCQKKNEPKDSRSVSIWRNRRQENMTFCKTGDCAGHYQMGCEG